MQAGFRLGAVEARCGVKAGEHLKWEWVGCFLRTTHIEAPPACEVTCDGSRFKPTKTDPVTFNLMETR